ncbi:uncharacterized protein LOC144717660 [Lampetra planeri]
MTTLPIDVERGAEDDGYVLPLNGYERMMDGRLRCKFCDYTCKDIRRLEEHMRTHTGEKPFRCQLCPFASAYVRHLEAHTHSHTGEKPYKCNLCSFRCGDRSNLSHHRRRRHEASGSAPWGLRGGGGARGRMASVGFVHRTHHSPQISLCHRIAGHGGGQWAGTKCTRSVLNVASVSCTSDAVGTFGSGDMTPDLRRDGLISDGGAAAAAHLLDGRPLGQPSMSVEHISGLGLEVDCGSRAVRIEECSQKVICWKTGRIIDEVGYGNDYGIIHSDTEEHIQGYNADELASQKKDKQTQRNSHNLEALSKSPVIASSYSLTQHSPNQSYPEKQPQHQTHREPRCHSQSCSPHTSSSYTGKMEPAENGSECSTSLHRPSSDREIIIKGNTLRSRSSSSSSSSSSSAVILSVPHVSRSVLPNSHSSLRFPGPGPGAPVDGHTCPHCGIWFPDNVLFTIHMGCHGHDNPFWCNLCGRRCHDRYDFNCHFALGQHRR